MAAAVGTREKDKLRVDALHQVGIDAIIVDSSQGNSVQEKHQHLYNEELTYVLQTFEIEMIHWIKRYHPNIDVVVETFFQFFFSWH